jgi:acetyltransferase-like isoleucine patch superfamily enzyme
MKPTNNDRPFEPDADLNRSRWSALLLRAYAIRPLRRLCLDLAVRLEGDAFHSATLRAILAHHHGVRIGGFSYGPCLVPGRFPPGVAIGRYVSIARGVRVLRRNHPMDRLSMHPFFFNRHLGHVETDTVSPSPLWIGHDAWLGENAIITPSCSRIGIGAVVGAGAVVTRDVPEFAIVAGNPAALIRYRFTPETIAYLKQSRFWEQDPATLQQMFDEFDIEGRDEARPTPRIAA